MFQFPGFPSYTYGFSIWSMVLHHGCSHIRISADRSLFAAPRSFSQLVTSFVGSQCQGILHMLFFAWTTFMLWSYEQSSDCSGLNITVLVIAWIAVFHTLQCWSRLIHPPLAKLFRFTLLVWRKNLISILSISLFFPFTLSVMYVTLILLRINMSCILFGFQWTSA